MRKRLPALICALMIALCFLAPLSASAKTQIKSADITVMSAGQRLKITGSKWIMLEGRSCRLRVLARPSGNVKSVRWSSSNKETARVSSDGKVTALAKGTAKITAAVTDQDGAVTKKTVRIKVVAKTLKNKGRYKGVSKWKTDVDDIGKRYDEKPQNRIIFYGNSSIRKWETLEKDMAGMSVLNHGFGGSTVNDCLYYADKLIIPYAPAAIVFYAGTNDIAHGYSAKKIFNRTKDFFEYIHCRLPEVQIYYLSMPLQPRRIDVWPSIRELNRKVRDYCKSDPLVTWINASAQLNKGSLSERAVYFVGDGIHLTETSYRIWTDTIRPVLIEDGYAD